METATPPAVLPSPARVSLSTSAREVIAGTPSTVVDAGTKRAMVPTKSAARISARKGWSFIFPIANMIKATLAMSTTKGQRSVRGIAARNICIRQAARCPPTLKRPNSR